MYFLIPTRVCLGMWRQPPPWCLWFSSVYSQLDYYSPHFQMWRLSYQGLCDFPQVTQPLNAKPKDSEVSHPYEYLLNHYYQVGSLTFRAIKCLDSGSPARSDRKRLNILSFSFYWFSPPVSWTLRVNTLLSSKNSLGPYYVPGVAMTFGDMKILSFLEEFTVWVGELYWAAHSDKCSNTTEPRVFWEQQDRVANSA